MQISTLYALTHSQHQTLTTTNFHRKAAEEPGVFLSLFVLLGAVEHGGVTRRATSVGLPRRGEDWRPLQHH